MSTKKIVIIGGGFGGITVAKNLDCESNEVILIDKTNHHLFQPLLYQVATAALSPGDISIPIRAIFTKQKNIKVILDEAIQVDRSKKIVILKNSIIDYDKLVIATGARHSYFGNVEWEKSAPGLKTLNDALKIREKLLLSFEKAERLNDLSISKKYLTTVIVGGGPTGVELAGAIAEISKQTIMKDFRNFSPKNTKVYLIEAAERLLISFDKLLSTKAKEDLISLGVDILLNTKVIDINRDIVKTSSGIIEASNVIWAAGNAAGPILKSLNTHLDKAGRVMVDDDLSISEDENVFVIGDATTFKAENGDILPAIAPVAIQQGRFVAEILKDADYKKGSKKFNYRDKGSMATIGRAKAVAQIKGMNFTGFFAWLIWCFVHILFLIGFRSRLRVMAEWIWLYFTRRHGIRLIVGKSEE